MAISRFSRFEERKQQRLLILAMCGTVAIIAFILLFGVKILIGFSVFVDRLHGTSKATQPTQSLILPPTLDPLPEATNSAKLTITGKGNPSLTLILYINEVETKKLTLPQDGAIALSVTGKNGSNTIRAKLMDDKGNISALSNTVEVMIKNSKPHLEVSSPQDNESISGDPKSVHVTGRTEEENRVTINDRIVLVKNDGSFDYTFSLHDGQNTLTIAATDSAGNQSTVERHITYQH